MPVSRRCTSMAPRAPPSAAWWRSRVCPRASCGSTSTPRRRCWWRRSSISPASPRKLSVWYSFWGEASSRQEYLDICGQKDEDFADLVHDLIERLIAQTGARHLDADGVALGLIGVLEVLWQGIAFQSEENIKRRACVARALAYLRSVFPGQFPGPGPS